MLTLEVCPKLFTQAPSHTTFGDGHTREGVQLGQSIPLPLRSKCVRIAFGPDEARDAFAQRKVLSLGALQEGIPVNQRLAVLRAAKNRPPALRQVRIMDIRSQSNVSPVLNGFPQIVVCDFHDLNVPPIRILL